MKINKPANSGTISGEKIIYVNDPEVVNRYNKDLAHLKNDFDVITSKDRKEINSLQDDLNRKNSLITNYEKTISDYDKKKPRLTSMTVVQPDYEKDQIRKVTEEFISKLKNQVNELYEGNKKLEMELEIVRKKNDLDALDVVRKELDEQSIREAREELALSDLSVCDFIIINANWRHYLAAFLTLVIFLFIGLMTGKALNG